jgi:hypothetical protein
MCPKVYSLGGQPARYERVQEGFFRVGADLGICRSYGIAGYMRVYEDSTHLLAPAKSR